MFQKVSLHSVFSNYKHFTICDHDLSLPSKRRVGKGGVTLLWRKDIDDHVSPLMCDDDRIMDRSATVNYDH